MFYSSIPVGNFAEHSILTIVTQLFSRSLDGVSCLNEPLEP